MKREPSSHHILLPSLFSPPALVLVAVEHKRAGRKEKKGEGLGCGFAGQGGERGMWCLGWPEIGCTGQRRKAVGLRCVR